MTVRARSGDDDPMTASDVGALLRRIVHGELEVTAVGETWDEVFAGDVRFALSDGSQLVVFNDCGDWDYVDEVVLPDGRRGDFDDWADDGGSYGLTDGECRVLMLILKSAPSAAGKAPAR